MWARKLTRVCVEEDGIEREEEYIEINESWYNILGQGGFAILLGIALLFVGFLASPIMAIREAYRAYRYANVPVPQDDVRERTYL